MIRKYRHILWAFCCIIGGVMLVAAASDLPPRYWQQPAASKPNSHHQWSKLERDLRPEACAQCHNDQFQAWKKSLHAHAYSEGLIGQFPSLGGHKAGNNCLVCHAPLQEQRYQNDADLIDSLAIKIKQAEGVDTNANLQAARLPLRHSGVNCATCHVRGLQRFGPPRAGSKKTGHIRTDVHGGFTASKAFESSQFCASCHQFPESQAINGKPLENTLQEWKESRFSSEGTSCQSCHMPYRRHEFKGIHDEAMVRQGVDIQLSIAEGVAQLAIHSVAVGHAFPTYVTPKVVVTATALDAKGKKIHDWQWEIIREVRYNRGWKEVRDTRIMPDETRIYQADQVSSATRSVRFFVRVIPDSFYRGVYEELLNEKQKPQAEQLLQTALARTHESEFTLFDETIKLPKDTHATQ